MSEGHFFHTGLWLQLHFHLKIRHMEYWEVTGWQMLALDLPCIILLGFFQTDLHISCWKMHCPEKLKNKSRHTCVKYSTRQAGWLIEEIWNVTGWKPNLWLYKLSFVTYLYVWPNVLVTLATSSWDTHRPQASSHPKAENVIRWYRRPKLAIPCVSPT